MDFGPLSLQEQNVDQVRKTRLINLENHRTPIIALSCKTMASTRLKATCYLCCAVLFASNKRRRLHSPSSEHVLMQLKKLAVGSGYCVTGAYSILPAESAEAFLCLGCFASVQKIAKLKTDLRKVEGEMQTRLRWLATDSGVQPCSSFWTAWNSSQK